MKPIVEIKDLSFSYNNRDSVLNDVNLKVDEGECLAILGMNGSGKSTLLKIVDGLIFPQKGEVIIFGKNLSEKSLKEKDFRFLFRKEVALLFQNSEYQLLCENVKDELSFTLFQLETEFSEIEKRVKDVAAFFEIDDYLDKSPHNLSEGEKKRIAFASLLPQNPTIFLLDEPTSHLDPKNVKFIKNLILKLNEIGKTIIFATHELTLVKEIARRVVVIGKDHSIKREGSPLQILEDAHLLEEENLI
jgi:cobalt/nickel transport system ATP-binding protein